MTRSRRSSHSDPKDDARAKTDGGVDQISVALGERSYDILIQDGLLDFVGERLVPFGLGPAVVVVTNPVVQRLYGSRLLRSLKAAGFQASVLSAPDGERAKSLKWLAAILEALLRGRYERTTWLLALGGGVVGDLAGFAASVYLRGIPFVQVPTTLVAQVDSSIGGKTGINHPLGKNLIGSFYQPKVVLIDPRVLGTLAPREYHAGLAEVIKYGVIQDAALFDFLEHAIERVVGRDPATVHRIIRTSCAIKAEVVSADEREGDRRRILNFGHTLGHALETVTRYRRYKHGEAVAIGMVAGARLAGRLGLADAQTAARIRDLVRRTGLSTDLPAYPASDLLRAMRQDKKVRNRQIHFVLPTQIGRVEVVPVPEPELRAFLATRRPGT